MPVPTGQDIERVFGIRQLQETLECDLGIRADPPPEPRSALAAGSKPSVVRRPRDSPIVPRGPMLTPAIFGDPSAPTVDAAALFVLMTEPVTCHSCHYPGSEPSLCCPAAMGEGGEVAMGGEAAVHEQERQARG